MDYSVPSRTDSRWPEGGERLQTRREKFRKKLAEKLRSPKTSLESWSMMSFKKILRLSKNMQGRCTKIVMTFLIVSIFRDVRPEDTQCLQPVHGPWMLTSQTLKPKIYKYLNFISLKNLDFSALFAT